MRKDEATKHEIVNMVEQNPKPTQVGENLKDNFNVCLALNLNRIFKKAK
jgi:hypothetical protein